MKNNKSSSFMNEIFYPRTKVLNEILDKCKTHGDKRGLGYINKDETPSTRETIFVKGKVTKQHLLALHHYAHNVKKLDTLRVGVTLSS